ncbi:FkbM family methyltransferase [Hoeflea sp. G2-23]|uniref:FkbM family methyltransferase n=1 Tax=Hoeflea algicola TaxID=2983763 RepID=A0ABT3ZD70_9HYPH|nr:FkbM family methyltransferase [Hoeflea algicola]MCY0149684.1 FkbM family methyltransferase [Hoeflea algicola]
MSGPEWKQLDAHRWTAAGASASAAEAPGNRPPNAFQRLVINAARNSLFRRGVFRATVSRLVFLLGGGRDIDIEFRDVAFRLEGGRNLIEYGILLNLDYNAQDIDFLCGAMTDGGVFVDVGCNIGLYSLPLARAAGTRGRCISIDANPLMTARLLRNAALSGLANVTAIASAVGDREAVGQLVVRKNDDAIVAVEETDDGPIRVRPLTALLNEAGITRIDGLKIDIEGHEDLALPPFLDTAEPAMLPRRIVIEHPEPNADYPGCAAALDRHGYQLVGRTRNNSLYRLGDG